MSLSADEIWILEASIIGIVTSLDKTAGSKQVGWRVGFVAVSE